MFKGQNEDTQSRDVGWNKYITITEQIYRIQVCYTTVRNVLPVLSGYLEAIESHVPPTGRVRHRAIFGEYRHRVVAQTLPVAPKFLWSRWNSPKKGHLRHQAINLAPPRKVRAWRNGPPDSRILVKAHLDWLTLEPGHNRPDPRTDKMRPTEVRLQESCAYALRVSSRVSIYWRVFRSPCK